MGQHRRELTDFEWSIILPRLPNKPRGVPRVDDAGAPHAASCTTPQDTACCGRTMLAPLCRQGAGRQR